VLFSVACTEKGEPIHEHAPDTRKTAQPEIIATPESVQPSAEAKSWEMRALNAKDPLREVVIPLANKVLDVKLVTDPKSLTSRAVQDELIALNHIILTLSAQDRARPEFLQLMQKYEGVLTMDCGEFRDSCTGLRYLKNSANSAQVVKLIAQSDRANYFRMLLYALELKNRNWDSELVKMLATDADKNISAAELKLRGTLTNMIATAIQQTGDKTTSSAEGRQFLENIHAWSLVSDSLNKLDGATQESLFAMMANSNYLYAPNGTLNPALQTLIEKTEADPTGFIADQRKIRGQNLFNAKAIGANYIEHLDELYFILEAVYTLKMSPQSAALLFSTSKKSLQDLEGAVQNYSRIKFLVALTFSSELAKSIYSANVQGPNLLDHFIRQSTELNMVWNSFINRSSPLKNFAILAARKREKSADAESRLKSLFDSIPKSISLASAYPHTLILFHLLSQQHLELHYQGLLVDTGDLVRKLYDGTIQPPLKYSADSKKFNSFELTYAFDMALRTSLFKIVKIDPDYFIADTLRRLNGVALDNVDNSLTTIQARFDQTPSYNQLISACSEFKGKPISRTFYFDEVGTSPLYGHLLTDAFTDVTTFGTTGSPPPGGLPMMKLGIFYFDTKYSEMIENARLDIGTNRRIGQGMLAAYVGLLKSEGLSDEKIAEKTKLTNKILNEMESRRNRVLETAKKWFDEIGDCYYKVLSKDSEVRYRALNVERAYLRQVYRDIKKLRAGATDSEKAAILARGRFTGLPSDFKGTDLISDAGYVYSQVDLRIRIAKYMTEGLKTEEGVIPPIAPGLDIDFGNRLDLEVHALIDSTQRFLPFVETEQEFVDSALKAALNGGPHRKDVFLFWLGDQGQIITWTEYLKGLISVYRLEHELKGRNILFTADTILKAHQEILNYARITPDERSIFRSVGAFQKFPPMNLDHRLVNAPTDRNIEDVWGLFDMPIVYIDQEQLGNVFDANVAEFGNLVPPRMSMTPAGKTYFKSRSKENRGTSIIPYNHELDRALDQSEIAFVRGEEELTASFHDLTKSYINKIDQEPAAEQPYADINIFRTIKSPLLTDTLIMSYTNKLRIFNITTDYCFASDKPCSSFEQ
ncbi:MAG: hypothetical protein ACXVA9_05580, partial [Bdellovibrionales bacterium]